jgi:putative aldouronate transport system permease protein
MTVKWSDLMDRRFNSVSVEKKGFWVRVWQQKYLFALSLPFMVWFVIFKYVPIWGWLMAFQKYKVGIPYFSQKWVGLSNFVELWNDARFWLDFRNTLGMSIMGLVSGFTFPIVLALSINELRNLKFKKTLQTVSYLPHFVSWVVVSSMFIKMLSTDGGVVNQILMSLHLIKEPVQYMAQPKLFWWIVTIAGTWKEIGWSSIIYLSAMAGIDQQLYDAAEVDGCGRFNRIWHVTLPGISPTIAILFIMAFGSLTQIGFERQMLMGNSIVTDYSEVIDLYALKYGIQTARYSFGTAVGVFNSVIAIGLLFTANTIFKRVRQESIF